MLFSRHRPFSLIHPFFPCFFFPGCKCPCGCSCDCTCPCESDWCQWHPAPAEVVVRTYDENHPTHVMPFSKADAKTTFDTFVKHVGSSHFSLCYWCCRQHTLQLRFDISVWSRAFFVLAPLLFSLDLSSFAPSLGNQCLWVFWVDLVWFWIHRLLLGFVLSWLPPYTSFWNLHNSSHCIGFGRQYDGHSLYFAVGFAKCVICSK